MYKMILMVYVVFIYFACPCYAQKPQEEFEFQGITLNDSYNSAAAKLSKKYSISSTLKDLLLPAGENFWNEQAIPRHLLDFMQNTFHKSVIMEKFRSADNSIDKARFYRNEGSIYLVKLLSGSSNNILIHQADMVWSNRLNEFLSMTLRASRTQENVNIIMETYTKRFGKPRFAYNEMYNVEFNVWTTPKGQLVVFALSKYENYACMVKIFNISAFEKLLDLHLQNVARIIQEKADSKKNVL